MTALVPRVRMFAGPNGSGKSTIKDMLPPQWLGVYVNADELEKTARAEGLLNLADFIRHKLLESRVSFTFETVMSSPDKVAFLSLTTRALSAFGWQRSPVGSKLR